MAAGGNQYGVSCCAADGLTDCSALALARFHGGRLATLAGAVGVLTGANLVASAWVTVVDTAPPQAREDLGLRRRLVARPVSTPDPLSRTTRQSYGAAIDVILLGGLWLDEHAWDPVLPLLAERGHRGLPVAPPAARDATLDVALEPVLAAVDAAERPVVVGHSAACSLAWLAADRRPDAVATVALVGGFPERTARSTRRTSTSSTA